MADGSVDFNNIMSHNPNWKHHSSLAIPLSGEQSSVSEVDPMKQNLKQGMVWSLTDVRVWAFVLAWVAVALLMPWIVSKGDERLMKSDLLRLADVQEEYFQEHLAYPSRGGAWNVDGEAVSFHDFVPSRGVLVYIEKEPPGGLLGWAAFAVRKNHHGHCTIFVGTSEAVPPAVEDNVPACTRD